MWWCRRWSDTHARSANVTACRAPARCAIAGCACPPSARSVTASRCASRAPPSSRWPTIRWRAVSSCPPLICPSSTPTPPTSSTRTAQSTTATNGARSALWAHAGASATPAWSPSVAVTCCAAAEVTWLRKSRWGSNNHSFMTWIRLYSLLRTEFFVVLFGKTF